MKRCLFIISCFITILFVNSTFADTLCMTDYFVMALPDSNLTFIGETEIAKVNNAIYNGSANYENAFFLSIDPENNITWTAHVDENILSDSEIASFSLADAEALLSNLNELYSSDMSVTHYTSGILPHTQGSLLSYELCADYQNATAAMIAYIGFINLDDNWQTIQITASRTIPFTSEAITYADTVIFGKTLFDGTLLTFE